MNSTLKFRYARLTALCATLGFASLASAQTSVTTIPVGAMTYSFPATTSSVTTYISIPLTNPSVFTGPVASLTANTITFSGTPFTATNFAAAGSPFFARIATGAQAGRTILVKANTTNSITLDTTDNSPQTTDLTTSGWSVAAGDRIEIIVGDTLASLFGDNTAASPLVFPAGTSLSSDKIGLYNKVSGKYDSYYFSSSLARWTSILNSAINAGSLIIYPETTIQVTRKQNSLAVNLPIIGVVPAVAPLIKMNVNNATVQASFQVPVDMKLGQLALINWVRGDTLLASSDRLGVLNTVTNKFDSYFQKNDGTWRISLDLVTDRSGSVVITAGSIVTITKKANVAGAGSYTAAVLPYAL